MFWFWFWFTFVLLLFYFCFVLLLFCFCFTFVLLLFGFCYFFVLSLSISIFSICFWINIAIVCLFEMMICNFSRWVWLFEINELILTLTLNFLKILLNNCLNSQLRNNVFRYSREFCLYGWAVKGAHQQMSVCSGPSRKFNSQLWPMWKIYFQEAQKQTATELLINRVCQLTLVIIAYWIHTT